jgi:hypothetical protein
MKIRNVPYVWAINSSDFSLYQGLVNDFYGSPFGFTNKNLLVHYFMNIHYSITYDFSPHEAPHEEFVFFSMLACIACNNG